MLAIADGRLTGAVLEPVFGQDAKLEARHRSRRDRPHPAQTLAVGDGANDLAMLGEAGLGVAFRAKPTVAAAAPARIDHTDLTALLYAQGFARKDFVEGMSRVSRCRGTAMTLSPCVIHISGPHSAGLLLDVSLPSVLARWPCVQCAPREGARTREGGRR